MLNLRLGNKPQEECSTRAVGSSTGATSFCCSLNSRLGDKSRNLMATLPDGNGNINSSMMITAVSERDAWFIFSTLNLKKNLNLKIEKTDTLNIGSSGTKVTLLFH